eukprot:TRINITY_DN614_c0_g2_i1.p1 TRINITY_DN614_c0_g2~~TRINITY_DN614_c0_g2_i1.p1  ORF type:complete len:543 (+),score=140.69 TRINITY_DN614_c0_g2_i1:47-1675(+)
MAMARRCGIVALLAAHCVALRPQRPQNVLLVISDDLRAEIDAPGFQCTAATCSTPHLRRLATGPASFSFTRAYVQEALCAPSRNSFLTGRRPASTKAYNFVDSFREPGVGEHWVTLPQHFKNAGYTAVGTGKVFHQGLPPNFDLPYSWDPRMSDGTWEGWMFPAEPDCPNKTVWCAVDSDDPADFDDTQITARALALLDNITAIDAPWFLAVGYRKPHVTWRFPTRFLDAVPAASVTLPAHPFFPDGAPPVAFHQPVNDWLQVFTDVHACAEEAGGMAPGRAFPALCQREFRRAYHASAAFMDEQVGRLLDDVEARGLSESTVVALFGDHGWQLGEWGEWEKFTNFELAARVPLIIRAPWLEAEGTERQDGDAIRPHVLRELVELVDVMPSLIDIALPAAAPPPPSGLEGRSLLPLMTAALALTPAPPTRGAALTQFPRCVQPGRPVWQRNDCDDVPRTNFTHMGLSVRTEAYRYTRWVAWDGAALAPAWERGDAGVELYNHTADDGLTTDGPYEAINIAEQHPLLVAELESILRRAFYPSR